MEFEATMYFLIWSNLGLFFLKLGCTALDKIGIPDVAPPAVVSLFNCSMYFFIFHSSIYAFITHPLLHKPTLTYTLPVLLSTITFLSTLSSGHAVATWNLVVSFVIIFNSPIIYYIFKHLFYTRVPLETFNCINDYTHRAQMPGSLIPGLESMVSLIHWVYKSTIGSSKVAISFAPKSSSYLFHSEYFWLPVLVVLASMLTNASWIVILRQEGRINTIVKNKIHRVLRNNQNQVKFVKFMIGILGSALFQYFFKLKTLDHVMAFLCFTASWLANLALLRVSNDFGVYEFLLGNMVVGCTLSEYGFGGTTWFVFAAALVLYDLRLLVGTASAVDKGGVVVFRLQMQQTMVKYLWDAFRNEKKESAEVVEI